MSDLLERLEKATGPDREIDEAIRLHFGYPPKPWNYTASIDAALALVERMKPGAGWNVGLDARREIVATIWWDGTAEVEAYGATAPLAILVALLSAIPSSQDNSI